MAKNFEGSLSEALDAAADEAVQEFEAQSEVGEDVEDDADVVEGDEEALEAADEQSDADESESDDEEPADGDVEASAEEFEWDGNPETVPENLKPYFNKTYETMRKGVDVWMSKKATEWDAKRQQYEARLAELEARAQVEQQKANAPKPPVYPGENATEAQIEKYWEDKAKYAAYEQYQELVKSGALPDPVSARQSAAAEKARIEAMQIESFITSQPGYTDEIGTLMVQAAESSPFWASQILDKNGAVALFQLVKTQAEAAAYKDAAAKANSAELQRKAGAAKRKVSKPQASSKKVTPARNFADMAFEDRLDAAIEDGFREHGL